MNSRVHPTYKTKYRVTNWAPCGRALVGRGDVTLWVSPAAIATWKPAEVGTRGGQWTYSDVAIETALTLRLLFLPLRQTEGVSAFALRDDGYRPLRSGSHDAFPARPVPQPHA
jgi:DDE family transposase